MSAAPLRVLFMGSPAFAVPSLQVLVAAGYHVAGVVTQPDRPAGRGGRVVPPEVKVAALELGLTVLQPDSLRDPATVEQIRALAPDLTVVAAFGRILPRAVLAIPRRGNVNVHASLLPRWRGASPIAAAILAGDAETGVSIMEMAPKMDAGAVISQARLPIAPHHTTGNLEPQLAELGAQALADALPPWLAGDMAAVPQDEALVTYCGIIRKEDGHLRAEMTAAEAERAVRAYDPWPGACVEYNGQRLGVWAATVDDSVRAPAGATLVIDRRPAIAFREGALVLHEVQRPGAKRLPGDVFLNGERGQLPESVGLA